MSKPPTASITSTSPTLKPPGVHHEPASSLPFTKTGTKPIIAFEEISHSDNILDTSTPFRYVRRATTFSECSPLLPERESIFATHYLPSDGGDQTPQLPAAEGADHVTALTQNLNANMEFALPSSPSHSTISFSTLLPHRKTRSSQLLNSIGQKIQSNPSTPVTEQAGEPTATGHTVRRVASEGHSVKQIIHLRVTDKKHPASLEHPNPIIAQRKMTNAIDDDEEKSSPGRGNGHGRGKSRSSMDEAVSQTSRNERSVSRGRTHVEKSIEATLPDRESTRNVRTRKSSHLMGIFKETAAPEGKPRDGHSRGAKAWHDGGERRSALPLDEFGSSHPRSECPLSIHNTSFAEESPRRTPPGEVSGRLPVAPLIDLAIQAEPYVAMKPSDSSSSSPLTPVLPSKSPHDPYFRNRDAVKRSMSDKRPVIPANLLEEIRRRRNLTATSGYSANYSLSLPSLIDVDGSEQTSRTKADRPEDGADLDDEDEEHISSAVYFPHPGPSDEDIEHFKSPDEETKPGLSQSLPTPATSTPTAELERTLSDISSSEHIDISVRSKHEESVFHGDYRPSEQFSMGDNGPNPPGPGRETAIDKASSASESELSSGDEPSDHSQAEGGDVTPTSTPALQSLFKGRRRTATAAAPRGAVVLEPYTHQVGGHSTMFRFSRRAICKQLNNRENEFYERIEQRHPDMLRFLPRYIGVLNVTFSKGPKPPKVPPSAGSKDLQNGQVHVSPHANHSITSNDRPQSRTYLHPTPAKVANPPRIVSQSQQVFEAPRVILDQNRHIVPFSLFDSPERPRSADPHHPHTKGSLSPIRHEARTNSEAVNDTARNGWSAYRSGLFEHSAIWGTTTVNSKLREQVLKEVFGPPMIYHTKRHAKGPNTLPRLRTSSRETTHLSEAEYDGHRRDSSIPIDQWRTSVGPNMHQSIGQTSKQLKCKGNEPTADKYLTSASEFEGFSRDLEKMGSGPTTESQVSIGGPSGRLRRRHSGIGLQQSRDPACENGMCNPDFPGDDGYGGVAGDEQFNMESTKLAHLTAPSVPTSATPQVMISHAVSDNASKRPSNEYGVASVEGNEGSRLRSRGLGPERLPLNPKEAQTQNPDQRVVYFLLLEDLTAGMGRPCVLDLKMGTRQYGIDANTKKRESQRRKCKATTSQQLGVRICGMQTYNVKKQEPMYEDKYFGRDVRAGREFREALTRFLYDGVSYSSVSSHIPTILDKLSKLESMVRRLPGYRFYASSLLMLYDAEPQKSRKAIEEAEKSERETTDTEKPTGKKKWPPPIEVKIVDFANCVAGEDEIPADAACPPQHPNDIDRGYLRGLRTLRMYFQRILRDMKQKEYVEQGEGEGTALGIDEGREGLSEQDIDDDAAEVSV